MTTITQLDEPMMTQHQVAAHIAQKLNVSERVVYDRWVHLHGFPRAKLLPTFGKTARKRWPKSEIVEWCENQIKAA